MDKDDVIALINIGAEICYKIKIIYYEDVAWSRKLADKIANKYTKLKKLTKTFYPDMSEMDFLKTIRQYSREQIQDCLDLEF